MSDSSAKGLFSLITDSIKNDDFLTVPLNHRTSVRVVFDVGDAGSLDDESNEAHNVFVTLKAFAESPTGTDLVRNSELKPLSWT